MKPAERPIPNLRRYIQLILLSFNNSIDYTRSTIMYLISVSLNLYGYSIRWRIISIILRRIRGRRRRRKKKRKKKRKKEEEEEEEVVWWHFEEVEEEKKETHTSSMHIKTNKQKTKKRRRKKQKKQQQQQKVEVVGAEVFSNNY